MFAYSKLNAAFLLMICFFQNGIMTWKMQLSIKWAAIESYLKLYENHVLHMLQTTLLQNKKHKYQHFDTFVKYIFNPFHDFSVFLYFLKYIRKLEVCLCFQGALKETSAMEWVKSHSIFSYTYFFFTRNPFIRN